MTRSFVGAWRRLYRRVGPMGLAALVCLFVAVLLAVLEPRIQRRSEALKLERQTTLAAMSRSAPTASVRQVPVGQQVQEFVTTFPPLSQNAEDLKAVFASARKNGILLPKGDYQFRNETDAPLINVTATLPVSANYAALKGFTADVLKALPHASLDELRMNRNTAGNPTLESAVRFTFVYRKG